MSEKQISPITKLALELGPVLVFFILYIRLRDKTFTILGTDYSGFIVVTAIFIPLIALSTWLLYRMTGKLARMQIFTLVVVIVFGSLTIIFNDESFFKMKPTILYVAAGGTLAVGLMRGKSYLEYMMGEVMPLKPEGWLILTRRITVFFFGLAVLNEFIWRTMSTDAWVNFKTFGLTAAIFVFFMTQGNLLVQYSPDADPEDDEGGSGEG